MIVKVRRHLSLVLNLVILTIAGSLVVAGVESQEGVDSSVSTQRVSMPSYDKQGKLRLPPNYREWILVGSSLGLNYSEGRSSGTEMFHETLMEPTAYRHFAETGEFANGTQLALILHESATAVLPGRNGRFAGEIHGVEMAVKDFDRFEEGWAYYGFGMGGMRATAAAFPKTSCHDCHAEHAARDNVFLQFYPTLAEAAGIKVAAEPTIDLGDFGPDEPAGPVGVSAGIAMFGEPDDVADAEIPVGRQVMLAESLLPVSARVDLRIVLRGQMGETVVREGDGFTCISDSSRPGRLSLNCHHRLLREQLALERELRSEGLRGGEYRRRLCEEVESRGVVVPNGALEVSASLAVGPDGAIPEEMTVYHLLWLPFSSTALLGIDDVDQDDESPWLHRAGTCQAHVMWSEERTVPGI